MPQNRNSWSDQVAGWIAQMDNEFVVTSGPSPACLWLKGQLRQLREDTLDDPIVLTPAMLVRFLSNRFRLDGANAGDKDRLVLPHHWASPFDDIAERAVACGEDLITVCRQVGGYDYGDAVANYVYAERRLLEARVAEVFSYLWAPIYAVVQDGERAKDRYRVGDTHIETSFDPQAQRWDIEIRRFHGHASMDRIVLSAPGIDRSGTQFALRRAQYTNIEDALTMLRRVESSLTWRTV